MKTRSFSGYNWQTYESENKRIKPGDNYFSSQNVWVERNGHLHLQISKEGRCAGLTLPKPLGYGIYEFLVIGRFDLFAPSVVAGLFLYETDSKEINVEFSRWGHPGNPSLHYSLHALNPYRFIPNSSLLSLPKSSTSLPVQLFGDYTTHRIVWKENYLAFRSLHGHFLGDVVPVEQWLSSWEYPYQTFPPENALVNINLWLQDGKPLQKATELVIPQFVFTPIEEL
ncbi:MAG: hypothetical protein ACHQ1H_11685 [Nitrososphaerales archaeon]